MRINIQSIGFTLTDGLRQHTERRLRFALNWAGHDLRKIAVRLSDINGPRGGRDKRCKLQVHLKGGKDVVIEDIEDDLYVAIDRVADRAERTVARQLQRLREHHHDRLQLALSPDAEPAQVLRESPFAQCADRYRRGIGSRQAILRNAS